MAGMERSAAGLRSTKEGPSKQQRCASRSGLRSRSVSPALSQQRRQYDLFAINLETEEVITHVEAIKAFVEGIPVALREKRGVYSVEFTVAEREAFS